MQPVGLRRRHALRPGRPEAQQSERRRAGQQISTIQHLDSFLYAPDFFWTVRGGGADGKFGFIPKLSQNVMFAVPQQSENPPMSAGMPHHNLMDKADIADDELGAGMQAVPLDQALAAAIMLYPVMTAVVLDAPAAGQSLVPASFQPQFGEVEIGRASCR